MTERASIFQTVQIGVEATPNTRVAATKRLSSLSIEPAIKVETLPFRVAGKKFRSIVVPNKEWVVAPLSGVLSYTDIIYPLCSAVGYAAPAQQGGTAAYLWTLAPNTSQADTVKTFSVEQGGRVRAHRFSGGIVNALGFSFSRAGLEVSGEMIGNALEDGIQMSTNEVQSLAVTGGTPTSGSFTLTYGGQTTANIAYNAAAAAVQSALEALSNIAVGEVVCTGGPFPGTPILVEFRGTLGQQDLALMTAADTFDTGSVDVAENTKGVAPTDLALVPVLPSQVDVYLADTYAGLAGASPLNRVLSTSWNIGNRFGPIFALLSSAGTGYVATVETEPTLEVKLKMEADAEGMDLLETLRAGDSIFQRIKAVGDLIAGSYYYTFQIDTALKVQDVSPFTDEDGVFGIEWTLSGVHDSTWGKATEINLTNELTAL